MFQNISDTNDVYNEDNNIQENRINLLLKELFKPHNCVIYILTILLSMIEIQNNVLPFGLAIVAACLGSTIPIFMVYIFSFISVLIFHGGTGFYSYFCISLIFFLLIFIFKPKISIDDRNEVFKVGTRLFFASFIYYLIKNIKGNFLVYDIFMGFIISLITYAFYKIFVNGIVVIRDYKNKDAYTVEEIIAAAIIFAIATSVFKNIVFFQISLSNILVAILVTYIGLKYGVLFGGISGLAVGASLTLISDIQLFQILIFISFGIIAGIFEHIIMPEKFRKNIFESEILLGNSGEKRLNYYEEIKDKINAVAQTIVDMNNNFFIKNSEEKEELNREIYIDNFLNLLENYNENIFYEDLINNENLIGDIFVYLVKEDIITEKDIIQIFRNYNNYILLRDQKLKEDLQEILKIANRTYHELQINEIKQKVKREENKKLQDELKNVSEIITNIPKDEKELNKYKNKEKEIFTLLKGKLYPIKDVDVKMCPNGKYLVELNLEYIDDTIREKSKIANIENLISRSLGVKCVFQKDRKKISTGNYLQVYSAEDRFALQVGCSKISKDGNGKISGDSNLQMRLDDGKYLLAISDGMGSGEEARKASKFVINSLNTLLSKGFNQDETIKLINSELNLNRNEEMYATVDISVLDLFKGKMIISKNGACTTYIKNKKNIKAYKGKNIPIGIMHEIELDVQEIELFEGDIILMCSDGLLESKDNLRSDWIEEFLKNVNTNNVQKIADLIMNEAIDYSFGIPKDDITVIVAKIIKKK